MKYAVAVAAVTTLFVALPASVPAMGGPISLGCEVVRAKTGTSLASAYGVVVKNTTASRLPLGTPIAVGLTLASGAAQTREAKLVAELPAGSTVTLMTENVFPPPRSACTAVIVAGDGPRFPELTPKPVPTAPPTAVPSATPSYTAGDGSGAGGASTVTRPVPTASGDQVAPRHVPTPAPGTPAPSSTASATPIR